MPPLVSGFPAARDPPAAIRSVCGRGKTTQSIAADHPVACPVMPPYNEAPPPHNTDPPTTPCSPGCCLLPSNSILRDCYFNENETKDPHDNKNHNRNWKDTSSNNKRKTAGAAAPRTTCRRGEKGGTQVTACLPTSTSTQQTINNNKKTKKTMKPSERQDRTGEESGALCVSRRERCSRRRSQG